LQVLNGIIQSIKRFMAHLTNEQKDVIKDCVYGRFHP